MNDVPRDLKLRVKPPFALSSPSGAGLSWSPANTLHTTKAYHVSEHCRTASWPTLGQHSLISATFSEYSDISVFRGLVGFFRVNVLSIFAVNFLSSPFIPSSGGFRYNTST